MKRLIALLALFPVAAFAMPGNGPYPISGGGTAGMMTNQQPIIADASGDYMAYGLIQDAGGDFMSDGSISDTSGDSMAYGIIQDAGGDFMANGIITAMTNFVGNGGRITDLNWNAVTNKPTIPTTNSVCQTNDSRAVTMTNANNVFGGTFGISSASYSKGILKIEKEIPLSELGWVAGLNPNLGSTPSPFFTRPAVTMWTGSASEVYFIPIPQWVTNLILRLQYEYTGTNSLTWTNRSAVEINWPGIGHVNFSQYFPIFTLQPTNYIYVMVTNTFPDMQGTNCVKYISYDLSALGNPNTATPINITGIHAWMTGNYDGTNW